MTNALACHVLDCIRDMGLHIGFTQWADDSGALYWVCSARSNSGHRWVSRHEDFTLAVCNLAHLTGFELRDG